MTEQTCNKWKWEPEIIAEMAALGFSPFLGYWVQQGDDTLYLLEEVRGGRFEANP